MEQLEVECGKISSQGLTNKVDKKMHVLYKYLTETKRTELMPVNKSNHFEISHIAPRNEMDSKWSEFGIRPYHMLGEGS